MTFFRHTKRFISYSLLTVSVVAFLFVCLQGVQAAPNYQINYQGKLMDGSGSAVPDGSYNMRFWLLTSPTIGTTSALWNEELTGTNQVFVTDGLFSVMLGSTSPLTGVDFNQTLYLGVEIGSTTVTALWDGEMSPRKVIGAVPAAFEAENANTLDDLTSSQFVRTDATSTIATSSADTLLTITQNGAGDILNLFDGNTEVLSILDGGNVGVGTSSPVTRFAVAGNSYFGGSLTATGSVTFTGVTNGVVIADNNGLLSASNTISSSYLDSSLLTVSEIDTSAELAALLSDETGTGLAVFNTNPLLSGFRSNASSTIGDGTGAGGLTISGNSTTTLDAYIGGSLGIGTTSPMAQVHIVRNMASGLSVDSLGVGSYSNLVVSKGGIDFGELISYASDSNFYIHSRQSTAKLILSGGSGTVDHVAIDSEGFLGIGTSSPSRKLSVAGDIYTTNGIFAASSTLGYASSTAFTLSGRLYDGGGSAGTSGYILQTTGSGVQWVATSSLGLGSAFSTSAELAALLSDETGTGLAVFNTNPLLSGFRSNASSTIGDGTGAGGLTISGNSTTTLDAYIGGSLGIGTTSPSARLTIVGTAGDQTPLLRMASSTGSSTLTLLASGDLELPGQLISAGVEWTARVPAMVSTWQSVTYGNGRFVAVSYYGDVMYSSDGIKWATTSAEVSNWHSITYGNGLFVAVAYSGTNRVMTSPDGITWTARSAAEANSWYSVTYGNGLFVAVSYDGTNRVMTSPDGITWTARSAAEANQWLSVTYGNGLFVAVANTGTNRVMTSPDGITWTARSAAEANSWLSVTYGNGLFVAVANTGTNRVMTSPDGITWTARSAAVASDWSGITYGNGLFVAGSFDRIMTAPDGITWTARSVPEENGWYSITYGNGLFVAVGSSGTNQVMTSGFTSRTELAHNNIYQGGTSFMGGLRAGTTSTSVAADIFFQGRAGANPFAIASSTGTQLLTLDQRGFLGLGSSTPESLLSVKQSDTAVAADLPDVLTVIAGNNSTGAANAGGIKLYAGGVSQGTGPYLTLTGGGFNGGSAVLSGGRSDANGTPGSLTLVGGDGSNVKAGRVEIRGGYSSNNDGGDVYIYGGSFAGGGTKYGDVILGLTPGSAQQGNIGIGTSTPGSKLTVAGDINLTGALRINGSAGTSGYILQTTGSGVQWVATSSLGLGSAFSTSAELAALLSDETGTGLAVFNTNPLLSGFRSNASSTIGDGTGAGGLTISGNSTTTLNAYIGGSLGIGTTSPSARLTVVGTGTSNIFSFATTSGEVILALDSRGRLIFGTSTDSDVFINGGATPTNPIVGGGDNIAIGNTAFTYYTAGVNNSVAIGSEALYGSSTSQSTGYYNVAVGSGAQRNITSGYMNAALGHYALQAVTSGSVNTAIGTQALSENTTGSANVGVGRNTLYTNTSGYGNTAVGHESLAGERTAALDMGSYNSAFGFEAMSGQVFSMSNLGIGNSAFGTQALQVNTTGSMNVGMGYQALFGNGEGASSTAVGAFAGKTNTTGSLNLFLGYDADSLLPDLTNAIAIGSNVRVGSSNSLVLGGSGLWNTNVVVGTSTPWAKFSLMNNYGSTTPLFDIATTTSSAYATSSLFRVGHDGRVSLGSTTPESLGITLDTSGLTGSVVAGVKKYLRFSNSTASAIYYGDNTQIINAPTATSTLVGEIIRITDNSQLGNTVRGLEVQAHRGTTTRGENTGISGFGRTFGVRGTTEGDAGDTFVPAGVFAESRGTTQGNALRAYSGTITTTSLVNLFQDTSVFAGTGLLMNFGNSGGSFSSTTSKFIDLQNAGTSKFTVTAQGTTTIGDGTTSNMAGLQIGYGGLCVDNDGSCTASTTGRITSVSSASGNSDLAEMYFSGEDLVPGDIVALQGGLSITRAEESTTILGVVSTKPGLIMGFDDTSLVKGESAFPVALKGRVPVRLSTENGPIQKGDRIALSSIPGVGMKAIESDVVVGIALEDFDGEHAYSPAYLNQFGDDLVKAKMQPRTQNMDARTQDGCSYGAGSEEGGAPCVKEQVGKIKVETVTIDTRTEVLRELEDATAEVRYTTEGEEVSVGQVIMFVDLDYYQIETESSVLAELLSSSTLASAEEGETVWTRLQTLAKGFVDGVLTLTGVVADKFTADEVETNLLCVGETCVDEVTLKALLESRNIEPIDTPADENPDPTPPDDSDLPPEDPAPETPPEDPVPEPEPPADENPDPTPPDDSDLPPEDPAPETPPEDPVPELELPADEDLGQTPPPDVVEPNESTQEPTDPPQELDPVPIP